MSILVERVDACIERFNEHGFQTRCSMSPVPFPLVSHAAHVTVPSLAFSISLAMKRPSAPVPGVASGPVLHCAKGPSIRAHGSCRSVRNHGARWHLRFRLLQREWSTLPYAQWSLGQYFLSGTGLARQASLPLISITPWDRHSTRYPQNSNPLRYGATRLLPRRRRSSSRGHRSKSAWQCAWVEQRAAIHVEAPRERVFAYYRDLDAMPRWSPWLRAVRVDAQDPLLTHWTLAAKGLEFTWQARMVHVEPPKRIAWESVHGLRNRGQVVFMERSESSTTTTGTWLEVELAFELPAWAVHMFHSAPWLQGFVERTLRTDLERFRAYVQQQIADEKGIQRF